MSLSCNEDTLHIVKSPTCLCKVILQDLVTSPHRVGLQWRKNFRKVKSTYSWDHVGLKDMGKQVYIAVLGLIWRQAIRWSESPKRSAQYILEEASKPAKSKGSLAKKGDIIKDCFRQSISPHVRRLQVRNRQGKNEDCGYLEVFLFG